jgi:signal transduction histidine kinase
MYQWGDQMIDGEEHHSSATQRMLRPRDVIIPFRNRILFATALILSLFVADGAVEFFTEHARAESALQINMSGRQRMLSQRISGFSQVLANPASTSAAQTTEIRDALREAIALMESSHNALANGNAELELPPARGDLRRHYFNGQPSLDQEVRDFVDAAKRVAYSSENNLNPAEDAAYIRQAAFKPLLEKLDMAVTLYQNAAERQLAISTQVSLAMRVALMLSIFAVMFGVVWPMIAIIRRSLAQFAEERNRANAASQAKSEFLATVSHEIRTPMNSILGLSGLLSKGEMSPALQRYAVLINESAKALMTIVNDVLDLSKIEAGKLEIEHITFSPRELVHNTASAFSSLAADKGIELDIVIADDTPHDVLGDPTRMRQILSNFVNNAIKFTEHGNVTVNLYRSDRLSESWNDRVVLRMEVIDTGIGFSEEKKNALFEAFSQADQSTTRQFGGTGLGLAIAKRLTEAMGGTIDATAIPGKGAQFWVDLPFEPAQSNVAGAAPELSAPEDPTELTAAADTRSNEELVKALVVDDKELNRIVLGAFLERDRYQVSFAGDGREAVDMATETGFDLILMDAQMPIMDGVESLHAIRKSPGPSQNARIIVVTADALEQAESRYMAAGFDGYLSKPITQETLGRVLRNLR